MVGAAGIAGIGLLITKSLKAADAIGKASDTVGLATESFQELAFVTNLAGTNQEQFTSNMTAFIKRVGEARSETGPLVSFLKKYDNELLVAIQRSTDQEQALNLVANAIKNARTETDRAALANAAFSRAGVKMTIALKGGAEGLAKARQEARDLGIVLTDEAVRGAEAANDSITKLKEVLSKQFIKTVADNSREIESMVGSLIKVSIEGAKIVNFWADVFSTTEIEIVNEEIDTLQDKMGRLAKSALLQQKGGFWASLFTHDPELARSQLAAMNEQLQGLLEKRDKLSVPAGAPIVPGVGVGGDTENLEVTKARETATKKLEILNQSLMDRETSETNAWFRRQAIIDENNELGLINDEKHRELTEKLEEQHLNKLLQMKRANLTAEQKFNAMTNRQKVQMTLQTGQQITQGISNQSKTAFKIHKSLALANAVVSLPSAIIQSYENGGGYPWGLIPAGLMLYAGIKQIQAIKNTRYGGGGAAPSLAGSGGGGAPVSTTPSQSPIDVGLGGAANDGRAPQEIHITIDGILPTDPDQLDQLADSIADNLRNGGKSPIAA